MGNSFGKRSGLRVLRSSVASNARVTRRNRDMPKVGVIGLGYWGPKLARNFHELPDAVLEWGCDLDQSRLDHFRSLYPEARTTRDYHEVLSSDAEAVCIATPVGTHYRLAMEALRAGKH